ncbi:hypothetical protein [Nocardia sp. NPDC050710]|uniref:hypothetical protein n=1 Tax=Nocardia sp. NPDC050710 TaxID=3157220 RepID=UPI0033C92896
MSDDSKQLSVAELLARNGAQGAAPASGGGRRRRSGRGISVAELTGDLPVIRDGGGHSAHAAPESEVPETPAYEPPAYEPAAYDPAAYEPAGYEPAAYEPAPYEPVGYDPAGYESPRFDPTQFGSPAPEPVSYAPQTPEIDLPGYSPMSGPIARYDPLSPYAPPEPVQRAVDPLPPPGRSNRVMPGREMPAATSRHSAPDEPDPYAQPADPYSHSGGHDSAVPPLGSGRTGRRRRRAEPDDDAPTEIGPPLRDIAPVEPVRSGRGARNGRSTYPAPGTDLPERNGSRTGRAARRRAAEADEGPSTAAWSAPANGFAPDSAPLPLSPLPDAASRQQAPGRAPSPEQPDQGARRSGRRDAPGRDGGVPAWSARRHQPAPKNDSAPESGGIPTAAWSLASQDQQLLSGSTVAGDLLRDGVERAERGKRGRSKRGAERAPVDLIDPDDGFTDVHDPYLMDADAIEDDDHRPAKRAGKPAARRSRASRRVEYDANRRQWLILGGQSAGAAIAGMLLFKGFERMWEMLPWVALALAMIVILGLVALVRILRRTDDILSTVIAVVVGIFVTLGPLAFLLSTN